MSAHEPELSREQQQASEAVRSLAPPRADAAFRARLRHEFASGAIAAPGVRRAEIRPPFWRRPFAWAAIPAAAAALFVAVSALNAGPGWKLVASRGDGEAMIDGVPVPIAGGRDLERRLRRGARLRLPPGGEIEIMLPGQLAMQVAPGSDVTLPAAAGRWFGRRTRAGVTGGEVRITTGAGFHGARLTVETPEAHVEVTGTTLAVICEPTGTCVCVLEGTVMVAAQGGEPGVAVGEGHRRYIFNDTRPPETAEIRANEHVELGHFRDAKRAVMEPSARSR